MSPWGYNTPHDALEAMFVEIEPVETETVDLANARGLVLAQTLFADRDHPAHDVSAMDGYALRYEDLTQSTMSVSGCAAAGEAPPEAVAGAAVRIFTGAPIPAGTDTVVRREDTEESEQSVRILIDAERLRRGQHVRRQGENIEAGSPFLSAGDPIHATGVGACATFGHHQLLTRRRLNVGVLVTGDEVLGPEQSPKPWQLRDSNGPALRALLSEAPWIKRIASDRCADDLPRLVAAIQDRLAQDDALILSGGVSMGDLDHVPEALRQCGAKIILHKLPIRPGKPLLMAIGPAGQPIVALPGNPVSALCTAIRFGGPVLRCRAGFGRPQPNYPSMRLDDPNDRTLDFWWYKSVRQIDSQTVSPITNQGSGDLVAIASSDGLIEIPPQQNGPGPWPFIPWSIQ
jgi:molybdopterin molybdotransferase